tara:strand:+ start:1754 stop:2779 length:1026 start_codon:yes stop_codon:yes gene_type:complete
MKVIVVGPDYKNYGAASYQHDFMENLKRSSEKYFHYDKRGDIEVKKLLDKVAFIPDMIFYNHGWLWDNKFIKEIEYCNLKGKWPKKIKHVIFLNKEYNLLDKKLYAINKYKFDLILTHLHSFHNINTTSVPSVFLPLACDKNKLSKYRFRKLSNRKYDLYFSGILQNWSYKSLQSDLRKKIQSEIFYCIGDIPLIKKTKYWNLKIYWKPIYKSRFKNFISNSLHGKRLDQKEYFNKLSDSKCVLHTSSPFGIISTRVFEGIAAGAIGLYSDKSNADVIFKNKEHFLNFTNTNDFIKKVYLIRNSKDDSYFQIIADKGRKFVENNHCWVNRIYFLKKTLQNL